MDYATASLNTKLNREDKRIFVETAQSLGITPSNAVRIFVRAFNEWGGFPFEIRRSFPLSADERQSLQELDREIKDGTVRRYKNFNEVLAEAKAELADVNA